MKIKKITLSISIAIILMAILVIVIIMWQTSLPSSSVTKLKPIQPKVENSTNFELQSKCSEMSAILVKENFPHSIYKNNYSTNLGKCFVEIITIEKNNRIGGWDYSVYVMDVSSGPAGRDYARLEMHVAYDLKNGNLGVATACALSFCEAVSGCYVGDMGCKKDSTNGSQYFSFNGLVRSTYGID